ncbi:UNKNOWN [Stylonychia lemnae]|uniref:Uncharacterized protein n=1 Tax=Stylonychia lemnae TaxID=5949 RepID=A0A078ASX3_STYLE|nr:UNKNOWN [Stylonychia lemnae]|eukprot:CDW85289.1 UNKNOWN [Stylonychia lemnae]
MDQSVGGPNKWDQSPQFQSMKQNNMNPNYQSMPNLQRAGNDIVSAGPSSGHQRPFDIRNQEQNDRKTSYANELKQQLAEQQNRKIMEKQQDKVEDMQYLEDNMSYNPFGRGGGGAPLRNQFGSVITTFKPQFKNNYTRLHLNRNTDVSVHTRAKSRHVNRNQAISQHPSRYENQDDGGFFGRQGTAAPYRGGGGGGGGFGNNALGVDFSKPAAAGIQNPDFQPDYYVDPLPKPVPKDEPQPDYIVENKVIPGQAQVQPVVQQEDEDRRRREHMLMEEERLRREKDDLDYRYQNELKDRQRSYEDLQEDTLRRLQVFWENLHDDEMKKWEDLMKTRPMVQYVERDDTLKLSQALVDHLQKALRTELDKTKANIDMQEVDLQAQINHLKKENFDADKERMSTLLEIDQINRILDDQKGFDGIRSKYVYQTLLWDKLLDKRLFQNKSIKDMPELLDAKSAYLKPKDKDTYRLADAMEIPDRPLDRPLQGINVDKINAERLNQKNQQRLNFYEQKVKQPEFELDFLDKELIKSSKKFEDAKYTPSRYGGLQIGEHQKHYSQSLKF